MDVLTTLQFLTLFLITLSAACAVGHALELPGKLKLSRDVYLAVQPMYYPGFTLVGGISEVLAIPMLIVLAFLTPREGAAFGYTVAALVAQAASQVVFWLVTQPVNRVWLADTRLSRAGSAFFRTDQRKEPAQDWTALRNRWEYSHVARAFLGVAALMLLAVAINLYS
jgi:hypothetical protein